MTPIAVAAKRSNKENRELQVLIGLVRYYLKTGKAVGSNTLKEAGFDNLSSATIRNYFAHLEEAGYLIQQHASGGRIPTHLAYRLYAKESLHTSAISPHEEQILQQLRETDTREIASYLEEAAERLSQLSGLAVFLSAPRFDQDYITRIQILPIDAQRSLCVILTDFGTVKTEICRTETKLSAFAAKRIESYLNWKLTGLDKPEHLESEEEQLAQNIYNEILVRYIVSYSNFIQPELYRTGLARLIAYPEFHDVAILASSLALFENTHHLSLLVKECCKANQLRFWIGDDLNTYTETPLDCTIAAVPYQVNQTVAGAIGFLGPTRIPYPELFTLLNLFAKAISETLTRNLYKFKITFRQPHSGTFALEQPSRHPMLLEIKQ
jgi:heat-inducible transcriptional repressor